MRRRRGSPPIDEVLALAAGTLSLALVLVATATAAAQAVTVDMSGGALHVRAPDFHFLSGDSLARLRDGRSLDAELVLTVMAEPDGRSVAEARQSFELSFDLWEERFAVALADTPRERASHLTAEDAEAWCVSHLAVPLSALARLGARAPIWVRVEYVVETATGTATRDAGFTIGRLIDLLSRRRQGEVRSSVSAGPFRLPG